MNAHLKEVLETMFDDRGFIECPFDFEKQMTEEGEFTGMAAAFNNIDSDRDIIVPGAFKESIGKTPLRRIKMLAHHDRRVPIGLPDELRETPKGLFVKGHLVMELQTARDVHTQVKSDLLDGLSIGFRIPPGGQSFDDTRDVRLINKIDLKEISFVTFPANERARVQRMKTELGTDFSEMETLFLKRRFSAAMDSKRDMERLLRDVGLSNRQAKTMASVFDPACDVQDDGAEDDVLAMLQEINASHFGSNA